MSGDTRFPYGYKPPEGRVGPQGMGTMLTWDEMLTKTTVYNMHPEVQRRFHALIALRQPSRRSARRWNVVAHPAQPATQGLRQAWQLLA